MFSTEEYETIRKLAHDKAEKLRWLIKTKKAKPEQIKRFRYCTSIVKRCDEWFTERKRRLGEMKNE